MQKTNDRQHFRSQSHSDDPGRPFSRPALTIISANVKGVSCSKEELIANICKDHHCDLLCIQETHRGTTHKCPKFHGMAPAVECLHAKHDPEGKSFLAARVVSKSIIAACMPD